MFCHECGQRTPERRASARPAARRKPTSGNGVEALPVETRRTVTVLFVDVTGSTPLGERLDPEAIRRIFSRYFGEVAAIVARHGGTLEKFAGDALVAVFGLPVLHEDDALRAVRAAVEARAALAIVNDELVRDYGLGLNTRTGDQHRRGRRPATTRPAARSRPATWSTSRRVSRRGRSRARS